MGTKFTIYGFFNEDGSATLEAREVIRDGTGTTVAGEGNCAKQADLSSITLKVFDISIDPPTEILSATLTISSVIFDSLQTDATWVPVVDSTGYNFRYIVPTTAFPTGDHKYRVEVKFTTTGGYVWTDRYEGGAVGVFTS